MEWTKEKEELYMKNQKLIYYFAHKYYQKNPSREFEDYVSTASFGLVKAVLKYEFTKGKFSTFAGTVIKNEIFMEFRKTKKKETDISLDEIVYNDKDGKGITLEEIIQDKKTDLSDNISKISDNEIFEKIISYILNEENTRNRKVICNCLSGKRQRIIANEINISQSYLSRVIIRYYKQLSESYQVLENEKYIFEKKEEAYLVKISKENLPKNFAIDSLKKYEKDFKFIVHEENLGIYFKQDLFYFEDLDKILNEIEMMDSEEISLKSDNVKLEERLPKINYNIEVKENESITRALKNYLLQLDKFNEDYLVENLDNVPKVIIKNVIRLLMLYNDIYLDNSGEYIVIASKKRSV